MNNFFLKSIVIYSLIAIVPIEGFTQNQEFNKRTCKQRLQGKWELQKVKKRKRDVTSNHEETVLEFSGDTMYWVNTILGDTLYGRYYAWTDIVTITETTTSDPFCDDFDDDICNDCEYITETFLDQQNSLSAALNTVNRYQNKKLNWNNFTLTQNTLEFEYWENGVRYLFVFRRL